MSVLSDHSLRILLAAKSNDRLVITPFDPEAVQPASYDIRLGHAMRVRERGMAVDPMRGTGPRWVDALRIEHGGIAWHLFPGQLYLANVLEYLEVPNNLLCHVHGRSSLGREGIVIHQTAGLVDPGYRGNLTLEITVTHATILRPEMPIGQLTFQRLTTPAENPYHGRYQDQIEPMPSLLARPVLHEVPA